MTKNIKDQFDQVSKRYDAQRIQLIPCFNDFYTISLPLLKNLPQGARVLDIGAGTGLFSKFVFDERPDLQFHLIDISGAMLQGAVERFSGLHTFEYQETDFSENFPHGRYDLIISALAIHHLDRGKKSELYKNCFDALNPNGVFINADQVEGRSPFFDDYYKSHWKESVLRTDLSPAALGQTFERIKLDRFDQLETQLQMLEKCGFTQVDCLYKYNNFVVFAGIR